MSNFGTFLRLLGCLTAGLLVAPLGATNAPPGELDRYFPRQDYPSLEVTGESQDQQQNNKLVQDIKSLGKELQRSVKTVSKRRNVNCFGSPCLLQGVPLLYSEQDIGFFGGVQARLTNISNENPYLYSIGFRVVRSDTREWLTSTNIDIPSVDLGWFKPRIKLRGSFFQSTEFRYAGQGQEAIGSFDSSFNRLRYSLRDLRGGTTWLFPIHESNSNKIGLYFSFDYAFVDASDRGDEGSLLFADRPFAFDGGTLRTVGVGLYADSRESEFLTRKGEMLEWGFTVGLFEETGALSYRLTLIDRRYFTAKRITVAHRLSLDGVFGTAPFWELSAIGGIDPIRDISASGVLKGYPEGRFHEKIKVLESLELRIHQNDFRALGQKGQLALMPLAIDLGLLNSVFAWSLASGVDIFWNRTFLTRLYVAYSKLETSLRLRFTQEF